MKQTKYDMFFIYRSLGGVQYARKLQYDTFTKELFSSGLKRSWGMDICNSGVIF